VAGHLGMTRFAVQGTSGGGPYALACAVLMPDQVQAVILTSAGGGISEEGGLDGMPQDIADGWRRAWRDPGGARAGLRRQWPACGRTRWRACGR
jgi:pimeloyl-ACP methyl ester carboxylesterase